MSDVRVIVCGSPDWNNRQVIRDRLDLFPAGTLIIHGGSKGADAIADEVAHDLGFEVICYEVNRERYSRSATIIRNSQMIMDEEPTLVLAFSDDVKQLPDVLDIVLKARRRGIAVEIIGLGPEKLP